MTRKLNTVLGFASSDAMRIPGEFFFFHLSSGAEARQRAVYMRSFSSAVDAPE
jgi:hypothetical protein